MQTKAAGILTRTSGFIKHAGFTHSLSPARNCTYGCTYCYVPTMGIYGGLQPEDWKRWGQFTTFKSNAADLVTRQIRGGEVIYCSPLVDPYQPAERQESLMPRILEALLAHPPVVFVIQTRGPLILRDIDLLKRLAALCLLRISFSVTTDREDIRRLYEWKCASFEERLRVIRALRAAGIETFATLAPLLPSNLDVLVRGALEATESDLIGDPLHTRSTKRRGATTNAPALKISELHGFSEWHDPEFQARAVEQIRGIAAQAGRKFGTGEEGFSWLSRIS
jgi:DNA repair photolyase